VVDLKRSETITDKWVARRAGWTPYDGMRSSGWPVAPCARPPRDVAGRELVTPSTGEPVAVPETLKG